MTRRVFVLASVIAATLALAGVSAQQTPVFRTGTRIVPLYVTVVDNQGRLVPDLTREDFQVFDNEKPQEISLFDNEPRPFTAVVMLDTSLSMTLNLDFVKKGAEEFFARMVPDDRASVGSFNDKIQFAIDLTGDRDALVAALDDLGFGNPTRLYDAVDASLDQLQGLEGRRVVVVFTDGDDTASKYSLGRVLQRSRDEEVMVYAVGLESIMSVAGRRIVTRPDRGLKKLAEETGGGFFELKRTSELGPTFTRVAQELRSQYLIGFAPTALDGKVHKLEVRMAKPGLSARARKSYLATTESAAPPARR
jgi:Ca-activated chloride channel family protein